MGTSGPLTLELAAGEASSSTACAAAIRTLNNKTIRANEKVATANMRFRAINFHSLGIPDCDGASAKLRRKLSWFLKHQLYLIGGEHCAGRVETILREIHSMEPWFARRPTSNV